MKRFKKRSFDLKSYYTLFLETGLIITLTLLLVATKINFRVSEQDLPVIMKRESIEMQEIVKTEQKAKPPSVPRPPVPVSVPNDRIIPDEIIDINADLNLEEALEIPPPPARPARATEEEQEQIFIIVEQMPELIGGLDRLQEMVRYPELAITAGIEGLVIVQFIVNEKGEVEQPKIIRGIGGGCEQEVLHVVTTHARFHPGRQRGVAVPVQYSLPFRFKLEDSAI